LQQTTFQAICSSKLPLALRPALHAEAAMESRINASRTQRRSNNPVGPPLPPGAMAKEQPFCTGSVRQPESKWFIVVWFMR